SASTRAFGLRWLRVFGSEARLLELCYVPPKRTTDLISMLIQHRRAVLPDQAREAFFRVTGKPFNTLPPPRLRGVGPEGRFLNELAFDNDTGLGGESVAGRVRGLSLSSSRLDGLIEPDAALGYLEWTLEFKNDATVAREARAQIQLPPGGVVSRLTL